MLELTKYHQILGIPYAALISVIFGLMIASFPIGAYVVFNTNIGNEINFDYPINSFDLFLGGINYDFPIMFELGDAFIVFWVFFVMLFSIAMFGPQKNFLATVSNIMIKKDHPTKTNYLTIIIKWFTILVVISAIINFIQEGIGIPIEPPDSANKLVQFFDITAAPIIEEVGFRVLLIGLPLFAMYAGKSSIHLFFKSLWRPKENLKIDNSTRALALIISVGILFGLAHVISGEAWSIGKITQATVSGIIIGWVYFRYGLLPAVLIHWATNYFIFSYVYMISYINEMTVQETFTHSLINILEVFFIVTGVISMIILTTNYINSRKAKKLEI